MARGFGRWARHCGSERRPATVARLLSWGVGLFLLLPDVSAGQSFTRITTGAPVTDGGASRSVNWVNVDGNGTLDLFVTNGPSQGQNNVLYLNDGAPGFAFTKITAGPLVNDAAKSDGSSWADSDNDGDPDAFVVNWYGDDNLYYLNQGGGDFTQVTVGSVVQDGGHSETCAWGDYDADGWVDLYVTNSGDAVAEANFLYHNNGDGSFTRVLTGPPVEDVFLSRGANWADFDNDGDLDLFVANESGQPNNLYRNLLFETGSAEFSRIADGAIVTDATSTFSGSWGDYDNDGDLDLFVANWGNQNNALYNNNGNGGFTSISSGIQVTDGGWSVSSAWGDFENDGDLDLFVTNAYGNVRRLNYLYRNRLMETGQPTFEKIITGEIVTELGWSYGCSWGDYDSDGDLDMFVAKTFGNSENNALFRNENANGNHWLEVRCEGAADNGAALGARVLVSAVIGGQRVRQIRDVEGQSGYCGQNLRLHFGLGDAARVDTLRVLWPSGATDLFRAVAPDQIFRVSQGEVTATPQPDTGKLIGPDEVRCFPNPFRSSTTIRYFLPKEGPIRLAIYSPEGRFVRHLVHGRQTGGEHDVVWRGLDQSGGAVPGGVYFYRLEGPDGTSSGRVLLLR